MSKRINTKKTTMKTVSTEIKDAVEKTEVVSTAEEKKKAEAKPKPVQKEKPANDGQLSLLDLGMTKAG